MPVTEYVARGLGDPYLGIPGVIVGGETAMDTRDGDASYVEFVVQSGTTNRSFSIAEWVPIAGPTPPVGATFTRLEMVAEFRKGPSNSLEQGAGFILAVHGATRGLGTIAPQDDVAYRMTPGPNDVTAMADASDDNLLVRETLEAWPGALPGRIGWQLTSLQPNFNSTHHVRITYLRVLATWVDGVAPFIPLRQFHRDDGYGVTPPRAFGGASRIRTGRAYGYD